VSPFYILALAAVIVAVAVITRKLGLFYRYALVVLMIAAAVLAYDMLQARLERGQGSPRIRFDQATGRFTFHKPDIRVRIVYASMFGPGEPVMRVRDLWLSRFEEEYSQRLAREQGVTIPKAETKRFVDRTLRKAASAVRNARRTLIRIEGIARAAQKEQAVKELASWLAGRHILLMPMEARLGADAQLEALEKMVAALEVLLDEDDPASKVEVSPRLVEVERRWQGRWVLTANRPRFLTGREVPDIIVGSKMELFALVQDDYAVAMNDPLPGGTVAPLDSPDYWGDPKRTWREAFIANMLSEGVYTFLEDKSRADKLYMVPVRCTTFPIFYNEVLFKKAGIKSTPRTWPEFLDVCEKLKAANIVPLTADADVYCDFWQTWLTFRIVGPKNWERTISGAPANVAVEKRRSDPPWTDPRHKAVYTAIRQLREKGYFHQDFAGYKWPAAQRSFAQGAAAMMICGSWLYQELGGYRDIASADVFKLNCFTFPRWPASADMTPQARAEHEKLQSGYWAGISGWMVCRQGQATEHAVELVKYLTARDHPYLVHWNGLISCMRDADFPPALKSIEKDFKSATAIFSRAPNIYARRFASQVLTDRYRDLFMTVDPGKAAYMTVDEFLAELADETRKYLTKGGERYYE